MKTLNLRFSELATLMDCQLKYNLGYAEGLVSGSSKPALARGSCFHALMQGRYLSFADDDARGVPRDIDKARKWASRELNLYIRNNPAEAKLVNDELLETLRWMYAGYDDLYGIDDEYETILSVESRRIVPLVSHLGVKVNLGVTADLIVYHRKYKEIYLVDHKTLTGKDATKQATAKENQLDYQRGTYVASYKLQGPKKGRVPIFGALHNTIRADKLKREMLIEERMGRAPIYFSDGELAGIWEEMQNVARDAVEIRLGRGRAKRMYSSPNPQECGWKCQFKEVHLTSRATRRDPVQVALDYGFKRTESDEFVGRMTES